MKTLIADEFHEGTISAILDEVEQTGVTYLVYDHEGGDPQAALVPWDRFAELIAAEEDSQR